MTKSSTTARSLTATRSHRRDHPAVDDVVGAGGVARGIAGEETEGVGPLLGRRDPTWGGAGHRRVRDLARRVSRGARHGVRDATGTEPERGADGTRADRVDAD